MVAGWGLPRPLLITLTRDPELPHYDVIRVTEEIAHRPDGVAHRA